MGLIQRRELALCEDHALGGVSEIEIEEEIAELDFPLGTHL